MTNLEQQELETIEQDNQQWINLGKALKALKKNPHFKLLIEQFYLENETAREMSLLAVDSANISRPKVFESMVARSYLNLFFIDIEGRYNEITNPVHSDDEEAELEAEEGK